MGCLGLIDELARRQSALDESRVGFADGCGRAWSLAAGLVVTEPCGAERPGFYDLSRQFPRPASRAGTRALLATLPAVDCIVLDERLTILTRSGQRARLSMAPALSRFDEVAARRLGPHVFYDHMARGHRPARARELRRAAAGDSKRVRFASAWHLMALALVRNGAILDTADRLERAVRQSGAQLVDWSESGDELRVTWSSHLQTVTSWVAAADLSIRQAGICVSGRDPIFDLTSLCSALIRLEETPAWS